MAKPPGSKLTPAQQQQQLQTMLNKGGKSYDPEAVYTESTSDYGNYEQSRTKFPTETHNLMGIIVGDRDEFRTMQDFIRNAVHHTLHKYIDSDPSYGWEVRDLLEIEDWNAELANEMRRTKAEDELFELFRINMNQAIDDRDWDKLMHFFSRADEMSEREDYSEGRRSRWMRLAGELQDALTSMRRAKTRYEKMADVTPISRKAQ
jgi:hypothetical protein